MEERKWAELEVDCLVNVLGRVGMESLLLVVPFVCKSWYIASLNPLCWRRLFFPPIHYDPWFDGLSREMYLKWKKEGLKLVRIKNLFFPEREQYPWFSCDFMERFMEIYRIEIEKFSVTAFMKFIIDRSCGNATELILPGTFTVEALKYVADKCPKLRILGIPACYSTDLSMVAVELIPKLKNMTMLMLQNPYNLKGILASVSINCKKLESLLISSARINKDEASAIVTLIPKVKHLFLRRAHIERKHLEEILRGCKKLVQVDVRESIGLEADEKILKLASRIKTFKHVGPIEHNLYDDYLVG